MRFSTFALVAALSLTSTAKIFSEAKELNGAYTPASSVCPTPEEATKKMSVPEGYEVRCFAHEPMVVNPVAMTWDARGRLWVVEAYEYPEGSQLPIEQQPFSGVAKDSQYHPVPAVCQAKDNPLSAMRESHPKIPRDRIVILEDTNNDGIADKRTVFMEGLSLGSAILCGDGGVYVAQQPHILHFKDTDGDDHADQWRVVLTGFGREDTHELLNSFCWGPDGWMYMTHGVFTSAKVRRPGEPEDKGFIFNAGIGRCKPLTGDFEVFADGTSNPWGCDYDARGNFFVSACVIDHFFHMAPGGLYVRQGGAPENPYSYELLPSIVHHKHFRAAYAGVQIYQGGVYPKDTWGHAFIGNIHDNAIHEEILTPDGASFKCDPRRDFLRANDGWFRPVSIQTGPDGNLWVMDWCDKYPCYQNAKANPEGVDRDKGRIWRVVYTGGDKSKGVETREKKDMDLSKLTTPELVKALGHSNNWVRRMASRQIVERWNGEWSQTTKPQPNELLLPLIKKDESSIGALNAIWTLIACDNLTPAILDTLTRSQNSELRIWAARIAGEFPHGIKSIYVSSSNPSGRISTVRTGAALSKLTADKESSVRLAAAVALRQKITGYLTVDPGPAAVARRLADQHEEQTMAESLSNLIAGIGGVADRQLLFSIWMAWEPALVSDFENGGAEKFVTAFFVAVSRSQAAAYPLCGKFMRRLCETRDAKKLNSCINILDRIQENDQMLVQALDGLEKGQQAGIIKPTMDTGALFKTLLASPNADVRKHAQNLATLWGDPKAIQGLAGTLVDPSAPAAERVAALQTLRKVKNDAARAAYVAWLSRAVSGSGDTALESHATPSPLLTETLRAASDLGAAETPTAIIALWKTLTPVLRTPAAEALTSRPEWAAKLLDAVEQKQIATGELPITIARYFANQSDAKMKKRAEDLIGAWHESNADIKALIVAKKKVCLEGEPDLAQGKLIFQTTCMVCHTFLGTGQKVGPDLTGSGRSNLDALLANVIDPNQIIGNGYENIIVTTRDNRTVSGRMTEDTPSHVKLLGIGGAEQVVARDQVASLTNTHQSVMPQGFGALPDEMFRNLAWYVLAPPEEGPLTKEKKKLLSQGIEGAEAAKKKGTNWHAADWESVSLWNPQWKVVAPEFERTPVKLSDFHGRQNVLLMHPFSKDKPCALERTLKIGKDKLNKLSFYVASHDQGDWELRVKVGNEVVKTLPIDHDGERWKHIEVDLSKWAGKEVTLRLEGAATGWSWEFGYWSDVELK